MNQEERWYKAVPPTGKPVCFPAENFMTNEKILKMLADKWESSDPVSDEYYMYYKCMEAVGFRTPKKRLTNNVNGTMVHQCPTCRRRLKDNQSYRFCPKCGQEIWLDEDEVYETPTNQVTSTTWTFTTLKSACDVCSKNPKNGGDGICHCTLGLQATC